MIDLTADNRETLPESTSFFSDAYVLRYLLQQACSARPAWLWLQNEDGGYTAVCDELQLNLYQDHSRTGSRAVLSLGDGQDSVQIIEPVSVSLFGARYATPEDGDVAQLLRSLFAAVRSQALRNEECRERQLDARKQSMYRRLLCGKREHP